MSSKEEELSSYLVEAIKNGIEEKNPEMVVAITRFYEVYFGIQEEFLSKKIDSKCQLNIGNAIYKNITVIDSDNSPVAIITETETIERDGYSILFNAGETN